MLSSGDPTADLAMAAWAGPLLADLAGPGGYLVCDIPIQHHDLEPVIGLPAAAAGGALFIKASGDET